MGDSGKKKAAVLGVSSILLVAAVVGAVTFGFGNHGSSANPSTTTHTSSKAAESLCAHTDYKETCQKSLDGANSDDPKELIKHAFNVTIANIGDVISKSSTIQDAAKDPRTSGALDICKDVLDRAISDFERSLEKFHDFDIKNFDKHLDDLKTWISAANTVHDTCLDAFENTTGDAGEKMKELLKTSRELSSNALAMVSDIGKIFSSLNIPGFNRRLMSDETYPEYIAASTRRLMEAGALKPNAVVAQDGSGQFKTIMEAVNTVPKKNTAPFVILIKAGVYKEYVELPKKVDNIYLIGEGPTKTKITGNKNYEIAKIGTFQTATLSVNGFGCVLKDLGIENSAGAEGHQAVALRVSGDRTAIFNCQLDGYQDTLYTHSYRQFYRDTVISGTIDFIFGDGQVVFQNCRMIVRKPLPNQDCMVTAQGRTENRGVGALVLQNCKIEADPQFLTLKPPRKAFLGRPWKEMSRTIIMQSDIDAFIAPEGFSPWNASDFGLHTSYYGEFQNRGPGSDTSKRVTWRGIQKITPEIANSFTVGPYIQGQTWLPQAGVPFEAGMMKV
ncbi:OLC1v1020594C1 [Oldenlandia corymbosa var. corymbosa]|uniref:Pectinesterase n=1 Tax=Oldenlandia corymbosa var. corymbosa TaxID=529605 RepID=A0AAV1EH39_OLDCO|nr:OLC1v1020594C1 [Oldenlandia corymbosa var. corymbosa]